MRTYETGPTSNSELKNLTDNWSSILSHISTNTENGPLLKKLIKKAKRYYPMKSVAVMDTMKSAQVELEAADDEDEDGIRHIIEQKSKELGDDEGEDEVEDDDDEEDDGASAEEEI